MIDFEDRATVMVMLYGETCKRTQAAKILGVGMAKINSMLEDGRLDAACEGAMVDVRSIARYIAAPKQEEFEAKQRRRRERTGCQWSV